MNLLAIALGLACTAVVGDSATDLRSIDNADWIARDVAVSRRVVAALPPGDRTATEWLATLAPDRHETHDLGYGGHRHDLACYGGYTTTWITLVTFDDRIVSLLIGQPMEPDEAGPIGSVLTPVWKPYATLMGGAFHYEYHSSVMLTHMRARLAHELGSLADLPVPTPYGEAYERLTTAGADLAFGTRCGDDGTPPPGRREADQLEAGAQTALLGNVLRGPNPVGRVYAAKALLRLRGSGAALPPEDEAVIAKIRASGLQITVCDGCTFGKQSTAEALAGE
ncbi:MAG: hypothetical protein AB7O52_11645 [Planctomycetota bacterium]